MTCSGGACPVLPRLREGGATGQRILYTNPDGTGNYRPKLADFPAYIGETEPSAEKTTDVLYLGRAPPGTFAPRHKDSYPCSVGWQVVDYRYLNRDNLSSGMQIKKKEFRQACEDRVTHKYQTPCYPHEEECDLEERISSGKTTFPWTTDDYSQCKRESVELIKNPSDWNRKYSEWARRTSWD